ncbi:MAG: DUF814 domain-containing protein [Vicinamibacteria bacterium]|nr:DUF814 domain-containing protein [Vicinamibacteria bacterium]
MDGFSLDGILAELRPRLLGRYLRRVALIAEHLLSIEISGEREARLLLDTSRGAACISFVLREAVRRLADESSVSGKQRHALLSFRKHVEGRRIDALTRIAGERIIELTAGDMRLAMRASGSLPAVTLIRGDSALATIGVGPPVCPLPAARLDREWDRIDLAELARVALSAPAGKTRTRAILSACPLLGSALAAHVGGTLSSLHDLRERLRKTRPALSSSCSLEECRDVDLTASDAVILLPALVEESGRCLRPADSWLEASAVALEMKRRGRRFARRRGDALKAARRMIQRLDQLRIHLDQDLSGLADPTALRLQAEALLAWSGQPRVDDDVALIPDPRREGVLLRVAMDRRFSAPQNANRLYDRARRIERARERIERRIVETRSALVRARRAEARVLNAQNLADLGDAVSPQRPAATAQAGGGMRRYLTSRGLLLIVGRGARENSRLTFEAARPDDYWLHVRDAAGAHVILRDSDKRAGPQDLREAAAAAAFFSALRGAANVDVHVTRRKHLRAASARGRVRIAHSETLRVVPSNPDDCLRRA